MPTKNKNSFTTHFTKAIATSTLFLFAALCIVGMGSVILVAYFGVPMGDDYLAIETFSNRHTWVGEAWHSLTHTGRYLQSITSSIVYGGLRSHIAVVLPIIALLWAYLLTYLTSRLLAQRTSIQISKTQSHLITVALIVLLVTAGQAQDKSGLWLMYQPFYFSSAIVTYTIAALLYATIFYLYVRYLSFVKKYPKTSVVVFFLLTYLTGLYNESAPAALFGVGILAILITYIYRRHQKSTILIRRYLYALTTSSLFALITMYLSPSGASRRETTGAMQDAAILGPILERISRAVTNLFYQPADLLLIAVLAFLIYWFLLKNQAVKLSYEKVSISGGLLLSASLLSLVASITLLVLGYGTTTAIYPRALLIVQVLYVLGATILSIGLIGLVLKKLPKKILPYANIIVAAVCFVGLFVVTPHFMERFANATEGVINYKIIWAEQDRILRETARTNPNATIYIEDVGAGIGDGFSVQCNSPNTSDTNWLNNGLQEFYNVKKICAKSDLQSST